MKKRKTGGICKIFGILKKDSILLRKSLLHKKTPLLARLGIVGIIVYVLYPIDILPDWLLGIGIIDDIGIVLLLIQFVKKHIPESTKKLILGDKK